MHFIQLINEKKLLLRLHQPDKTGLLKKMVDAICTPSFLFRYPAYTAEILLEAILAREAERTTVVGEGVAFPHARLPGFHGVEVVLATLDEPIDFDGGESEPVNIVCMVLTPRTTPTASLKIMAGLTRGLVDPAYRKEMVAASDPAVVVDMLSSCDVELEIPICGTDLMQPSRLNIHPDTPVSEIALQFFEQHLDAAPVVDDGGRIVGEVTTNRMFRFGLPPFFHQLKSVSFISAYDPFEKYFMAEDNLTAADIMLEKVARHHPDSTVLEIVFDLAVQRYPLVYIVDDDERLLGVVDRSSVLQNIINF